MVEKLENAILKSPMAVLLLLVVMGGGGTFVGRLTAPSQDAKIAVLEERIIQLCEMKIEFKNDIKQILNETQKIQYFDKRLEEMSRRIQDLEKKISLVFEIDAAYRSAKEGKIYGDMCQMPVNN